MSRCVNSKGPLLFFTLRFTVWPCACLSCFCFPALNFLAQLAWPTTILLPEYWLGLYSATLYVEWEPRQSCTFIRVFRGVCVARGVRTFGGVNILSHLVTYLYACVLLLLFIYCLSSWHVVSSETVESVAGSLCGGFFFSWLLQGERILEQCSAVWAERCLAGVDAKFNPTYWLVWSDTNWFKYRRFSLRF